MNYRFEWMPGLLVVWLALILPLAPAFALIAVVVAAIAAVAALVALAGAILATPYLVVRTVRRRLAERHSLPIPAAIAHAAFATARRPQ